MGFLAFILIWAIIGANVTAAVTILETILWHRRGPEFMAQAIKWAESAPKRPLWKTLLQSVFLWPILLGMFVMAGLKGQCLVEFLHKKEEDKPVRIIRAGSMEGGQLEKLLELPENPPSLPGVEEFGWTTDPEWVPEAYREQVGKFQDPSFRWQRVTSGMVFMTHIQIQLQEGVGPLGGHFIAFRFPSGTVSLAPISLSEDRIFTQRVCDHDTEWNRFCVPGREEDRDRYFAGYARQLAQVREDLLKHAKSLSR